MPYAAGDAGGRGGVRRCETDQNRRSSRSATRAVTEPNTAWRATRCAILSGCCRHGGRIGLANWTPEGFIGQVFKTLGRYVPPPAGVASPALWGTRARIDELFASEAASIVTEQRYFNFRYRSPERTLTDVEVGTGVLLAGAFLALVPSLVVYLLLQNSLVKGITTGAVKG